MTLRTLREAQERLDALACSVQTRKQLQAQLDAERQRLIDHLGEANGRTLASYDDEVADIRKGLKSLAKQFDELAAEADVGDIAAQEYGARFDELRATQDGFNNRAERLRSEMELLEQFEADPDSYVQDFQERHPSARIEVPW